MLHWCSATAIGLFALAGLGSTQALAEIRSLTLHNLHTEEQATITFKRDGVYDADGLKQLDTFLRDPIDQKSTFDMDPHLFDLLWDVYQQSGSSATIEVLDGYRSPATNAWLRKNSDGVAQNSLHMKGQAIDFYIPGVALAKLRAIGLRMQAGGVGFYPDSGSPFVHLDTGSVRHWPLMSRQQLLAVFPDGKTLDIPTDGDPLPGYKQALAAYNQRQAQLTPATQVASFSGDGQAAPGKPGLFGRIVKAVTKGNTPAAQATVQTASTQPAQPGTATQPLGVAVAASAPTDGVAAPKPNLSPRPQGTVVAALTPAKPAPPAPVTPKAPLPPHTADFASPDFWTAPTVPTALALAMAGREVHQPGASVPIAPTAVVATVAVKQSVINAGVITTAVIRSDAGSGAAAAAAILAYAPEALPAGNAARLRPAAGAVAAVIVPTKPAPPALLMTGLDTQGLRLWMNGSSTRQRAYAMLTMPELGPTAMSAPAASDATSFAATPAVLRTDRFSLDAR